MEIFVKFRAKFSILLQKLSAESKFWSDNNFFDFLQVSAYAINYLGVAQDNSTKNRIWAPPYK